jgi:hypothetical protein
VLGFVVRLVGYVPPIHMVQYGSIWSNDPRVHRYTEPWVHRYKGTRVHRYTEPWGRVYVCSTGTWVGGEWGCRCLKPSRGTVSESEGGGMGEVRLQSTRGDPSHETTFPFFSDPNGNKVSYSGSEQDNG